tara:strand:- start:128 stop:301 length:174 start_codon:yes stop_codon:yes gene_type:complete
MIKINGCKIKTKKIRSSIFNQNSYFVSRKKINKLKINLSSKVVEDIKQTLEAIKSFH